MSNLIRFSVHPDVKGWLEEKAAKKYQTISNIAKDILVEKMQEEKLSKIDNVKQSMTKVSQ